MRLHSAAQNSCKALLPQANIGAVFGLRQGLTFSPGSILS